MIRISRSFVKGSALYTLVGALPMASAVLLLPFYMAHLSTAHFGALSIYLAFSLLVQLVVTYSYDTSLYVHYHEYKDNKTKLAIFISSAFVFMLFVGLGLLLAGALLGDYVFSIFFSEAGIDFYPYGWLAIIGGALQAIFKVHSSLLQTREKQEAFFWSSLLLFVGIFAFTLGGLLLFPASLSGPMGGRALALVFGGAWVVYRIGREFGFQFNFAVLTESFSFNFYSFIYQLQQWVINYFDRVLMVFYLPLAVVGEYDFAVQCLIGIELFMNGLHNSFFPKVVKEVTAQTTKGSTEHVNRYYHGLVAVTMLVVCFAVVVLPLVITMTSDLLGRPDYKAANNLVPYIAVLYLLRSIRLFFIFPYGVLKYTKPLPIMYVAIAGVKIGALLLLIPTWGIQSVIIASFLSLVVEITLLRTTIASRFFFKFNQVKMLLAPASFLFVIVLFESLSGSVPAIVRYALYTSFCFGILFFAYRNELTKIDLRNILK
jgi:O-antigen/teichoic acid export membrane protein